jgi:hypothetical protein
MSIPILMFQVMNVGIIAFTCISNGRRFRLFFKRTGTDSTEKGGAV